MGAPLTPTPRDPAPGDPKTPLVWGQGVPGPRRDTRGWCCRVEGKKCLSVEVLAVGCAELCQTILVVLGCAELCHTGSARLCQTVLCLVVLGCAKPSHWCQAVSSCASSARLCQHCTGGAGLCQAMPYQQGQAVPNNPSGARLCQAILCWWCWAAPNRATSAVRLSQRMPAVPDCAEPRWQCQTEPKPTMLVVPGCAKASQWCHAVAQRATQVQ